ncbi:membrane protein [Arthrobacter phage Truckee]|nr:membrane protein [Arthrobacter phage Truckee]
MDLTEYLMGMAMMLGTMAIFAVLILLFIKASIVIKAAKTIMEMPLFWKYFLEELKKERNK